MKLNLDRFTAAQLAEHVAAGDFSATEIAQASLEAIEAREGGVQAFLQVAPELALEAAAKIDARRAAGEGGSGDGGVHVRVGLLDRVDQGE